MKNACIVAPLLAFCLLGLAGCNIGGKSTPAKFYVLSSIPENSDPVEYTGEPPQVGISRIQIPAYLDRPQMVTYVTKSELRYNEFNRWGEPLQQDIAETVRTNLVTLVGPNKISAFPWMQEFPRDYNVQIVFQNFEGHTYRNEVILRAVYRIERLAESGRETVHVAEVEYTMPISGEAANYDAIVDALSKAVIRLSREIATKLQQLEAEGPAETGNDADMTY